MLRRRIPVVALALSALLLATVTFAQTKPEPRPLLVGVVDIGIVFKGYRRKEDLEAQVNAHKNRLEAQAKDEAQIIDALRKAVDLLKEGSDPWREKRYELKLEIKKAEVMRERMEEELKLEVENLTLQILDEIEGTVRDYGKKNGFDVIIKVDSKGWGDERFQERIFRAQITSVMYFDTKLDLTSQVLEILNDPETLKTRKFR